MLDSWGLDWCPGRSAPPRPDRPPGSAWLDAQRVAGMHSAGVVVLSRHRSTSTSTTGRPFRVPGNDLVTTGTVAAARLFKFSAVHAWTLEDDVTLSRARQFDRADRRSRRGLRSVRNAVLAGGLALGLVLGTSTPALADPDHGSIFQEVPASVAKAAPGAWNVENATYDEFGIPIPHWGTLGVPETLMTIVLKNNGTSVYGVNVLWSKNPLRNPVCNTSIMLEAIDARTGEVYFSSMGDLKPGCAHEVRRANLAGGQRFRVGEIRATLFVQGERTKYSVSMPIW